MKTVRAGDSEERLSLLTPSIEDYIGASGVSVRLRDGASSCVCRIYTHLPGNDRASHSEWLRLFATLSVMSKEPKPTKDDVARLIQGKPSKRRVGSRQIRHRLRNDELARLLVARSRGYLTVTPTTRAALQNAWHLDRLSVSEPCLFVRHTEEGYIVSGEHNRSPLSMRSTSLKEVEDFLRRLRS
jgi:hypothetical protein